MLSIPLNIALSISFQFEFYPLLIIIFVAFLIPIVLSVLKLDKIPGVIVEIIVGYLIGKFIVSSFTADQIQMLDFLALSGFMFLMFLGGLEIDVKEIIQTFPRRRITVNSFLKNPLLVGITFFLISLLLSYSSALFLGSFVNISNPWYFALIMVTTSVGIILPVLKGQNKLNTRFGQMVMTSAAIADIFSIILFSFTAFILKHGFQSKLLLIFALFFLFYLLYLLGHRLAKKLLVKRISYHLSHASSQIQIRGTILLILVFIVLAQYIGMEVMLLGAFLAGLLISVFMNKNRSILLLKLDGMAYGFFIPIFFIMVGVHFDDTALAHMGHSPLLFLILLFVFLYLIKVIPSLLWVRLFGLRKSIAGGVLMASRLSLIIAASKIGLDFGIITPGINAAFVLMAVVTCLISPVTYSYLNPKSLLQTDKMLIVGGSSTGVLLARRLNMHGKRAIIIEKNKKRYEEMRSKGLNTIHADGLDVSIYKKLNLRPQNYIIALTESESKNADICDLLTRDLYHSKIISRTSDSLIEQKMRQLNIEYLDITRIMATTIENLIFRPNAYHALVETFENYQIEDIQLLNKYLSGKQVKDIPFHEEGKLILIKKGSQVEIPGGDTYLQHGCMLTVMGTDSALRDFRLLCSYSKKI